MFIMCVVRCGSKNEYQKSIMRFEEVGLHAQKFVNHSRLNSYELYWEDLYVHLIREFDKMNIKIFI